MEVETCETLTNVLEKHEVEKIPPDIVTKLEKYCESKNEELMTTKTLYDTATSNNDKLRHENDELTLKTKDIEEKIAAAQINITTLTLQLETAGSEILKITTQATQFESEMSTYRKERNDIIDERDQLRKISERKDGTIERLLSDAKIMEAQLKSAVSAKSDALARLDLIEGKEHALEFKEKRIERENEFLKSDIANLTENLNKNIAEQLALRQEHTAANVQWEIELKQKTEELRISNATICQLNETNQMLTNQNEENMYKLKEQVNESARLMDHYQKEIDAKIKLAELYKENSDDCQAQTNELTAAVKELKRLLHETTDECGVLETKLKGIEEQHQTDLDAKEEVIGQLRQELKIANGLLQTAEDENAEKVFENFIPSAAATNRRLKSGITLTEVYSRYYTVLEELQSKDREYNQLKLDTESIIQELKEKAPEFERQHIEYKKVVAVNEELTQKIDNYIAEKVLIREELQETRSKFGYLERENVKLKSGQNDLARQVCYLLAEIEASRGGMTSDQSQSISSDMPANEVISKKLVTFNNIVEMQENNQKLLLLVRDLSTKLEEMEEIQNSIDVESYEAKISGYEKRLQDAEQSRRANEDLLTNCLKQKDRFKQLYYEIMRDFSKKPLTGSSSFIAERMEGLDDDVVVISGTSQNVSNEVTDKKFSEIEQLLDEKKTELKELKEEYNEYRKEKSGDIKLLNDEINALRIEVRELTVTNLKMSTQENYINEQVKTQQKNVAMYKKQIKTLEERNQTLDKTIGKHEITQKFLKDEVTNTMKKLSAADSRCEQLQRECRRLVDVNRSLEVEHQSLNREKLTNSMLQNNLEMIKGSFERLDNEGRTRLEQRLDDTYRECSALRRRLQEEQDHFREEMNAMKLRTEEAVKKMSDEQAQAETLRAKLTQAEEQIQTQNQKINDLSKNIEQTPTTSQFDTLVVDTNSKLKDLELQLKTKNSEIEKLAKQISRTVEKETELRTLASTWEAEAESLKKNFDTCKAKMAADLQTSRLNETKLKSQVEELQTEIRLQITDTDSSSIEAASEGRAQKELKEALLKISERDRELRDLRSECHKFKVDLQTIEHKYSNEMQIHSSDLQALTLCKDELSKCQEQIDELKAANNTANENLKQSQLEWEKLNKQAADERLELEQKMECLDQQNTALHDQLQAENNKVLSANNDSLNDSIANSSILNRTLTEDEVKDTSTDKLMKVIKFLRKEKDISVTKVEILKTENSRLLSKFELQRKRLNELNIQLTEAEAPANVANVGSAAKYNELMRKVETLNAMTDSNIHLREERDALVSKVKELTERVTKLEDELFPLQEKNRELLVKHEEQTQISNMLRTNVDHWRKRASDLVERNNKNPEDFKRLQNERENLAKMLTTEKENLRQVNEELNSLKSDKIRLEQEVAATNKQLHTTVDERKKIQDELNNLKQTNIRLTQETIEVKSAILKKEDEMKAMQVELSSKDTQLTDSKNKEIQIRRIAKKYKDSFYELKTKEDEREADLAAKSLEEQAAACTAGGSVGLAAARVEMEKVQAKKIDDLTSQLASCQEEIDQLRKENENLKKQDEKNLLAELRNRIGVLTEANRQLSRENQTAKSQLQTCEQSRSEHDSAVAAFKSQLEAKAKELLEQDSLKETIARLTRENETLTTRVNQLHRQFQQQGSKPSTSSGTIEKSPSDPARTANVKPMATPSAQQSATLNIRRGGDTPLASIRPMSVQNSRTAAVLPTSQTSNIAAVQGSSTGSVTTALVPPQQQVHTTGNSSTAEAMSSSPTSSHTDYMPATSSAVVVAVPPMGSTSAESTQEAESLSVNTNESSSSSSTSSQAVLQQQAVALVSPRVEVTPQNVLAPSQQVLDQNQAASTSGSSSSFLTAMSSHHQASSSNTVTTTQAGGHKRPRDAEGDSSTGVEESSASEKTSPQNKRTRLGEQTFQGVTESGLDVEYQVPTSSQRDQEDDVVAVDSEDEDDDGMDDEATADVDEAFDAENGDTDEIESFGQDEGEGHDIDEDNVQNDTNEVDVDDSSDAPNQSSSGIAASSGARANLNEVIELSPLSQETQQIQMISSGSDAGPSGQANTWRQVQTPVRQQQNLVIQQAYEEVGDDSIVPSTPTLYVARRADGFSEAVSSPHPIVPHASRFTFNESGASSANRAAAATLCSAIEGMDDTRMDLNLLDESADGGQSSSINTPAHDSDNQQIVVVDLVDESSNENKEADQKEPVAGPSSQAEGTVPQILVTDAENERNTYDESASTSQVTDDKNISIEVDVEDEEDMGTDGVSSEGEKSAGQDGIQVEEGREAEASIQMSADNAQLRSTRSRRTVRGGRSAENQQRPTPIVWDEEGRDQQVSPQNQQHTSPHRGGPIRGQLVRGSSRGRPKRPYRS